MTQKNKDFRKDFYDAIYSGISLQTVSLRSKHHSKEYLGSRNAVFLGYFDKEYFYLLPNALVAYLNFYMKPVKPFNKLELFEILKLHDINVPYLNRSGTRTRPCRCIYVSYEYKKNKKKYKKINVLTIPKKLAEIEMKTKTVEQNIVEIPKNQDLSLNLIPSKEKIPNENYIRKQREFFQKKESSAILDSKTVNIRLPRNAYIALLELAKENSVFPGTIAKSLVINARVLYPYLSSNMDIRKMREQVGISQKELADALGMPYQNLSAIEHGRRNLSEKYREKLETMFNDIISNEKAMLFFEERQMKKSKKQEARKDEWEKLKAKFNLVIDEKKIRVNRTASARKVEAFNEIMSLRLSGKPYDGKGHAEHIQAQIMQVNEESAQKLEKTETRGIEKAEVNADKTLDERIVEATQDNYKELLPEIAQTEDRIRHELACSALAKRLGVSRKAVINALGDLKKQALIQKRFSGNIKDESDKLIECIIALLGVNHSWQGKTTDLLAALRYIAINNKIDVNAAPWAQSPEWLGRKLEQIRPILQNMGMDFNRKKKGNYRLLILKHKESPSSLMKTEHIIEAELLKTSAINEDRGVTEEQKPAQSVIQPPTTENKAIKLPEPDKRKSIFGFLKKIASIT